MRRNFILLILFVSVLLVLDRFVYAGAMYLRDHGRHPEGIDLIYQDHGWSPDIVFLGDSRTRRNFDMQTVERKTGLSSYDLGYDGASAEEALFILKQFLIHKHSTRVAVFEADPPMLDAAYGTFYPEHFQPYVAVLPDPSELLQQKLPTLQERATAFASTWVMKSAAFPNRLPDLLARWREPFDVVSPDQAYPCGPKEMHYSCLRYHGEEVFVGGHGDQVTPKLLALSISSERKALYTYLASLTEENDFSLLLLQTPRLDVDKDYPPQLNADADEFFCGLARTRARVLYARVTHVDGIDHDVSLYWDWAHFNSLGAQKMSQLIAPLVATMAKGSRPEACVFE